MAWDIAASAALIGIAAIRLRYKASSDSVEDTNKKLRTRFAAAIGAARFYLFITGISYGLLWRLTSNGGIYNILFGGVAALGGLATFLPAFSSHLAI